jgi:hypothetical protein
MVWGEQKVGKKIIYKVRGTTKNRKTNHGLGGAESSKKLISKVRRNTKNMKKAHGLSGVESGRTKMEDKMEKNLI